MAAIRRNVGRITRLFTSSTPPAPHNHVNYHTLTHCASSFSQPLPFSCASSFSQPLPFSNKMFSTAFRPSRKVFILWNEEEVQLSSGKKISETIKTIQSGLEKNGLKNPSIYLHIYTSRSEIKKLVATERREEDLREDITIDVFEKKTGGPKELQNAMMKHMIILKTGVPLTPGSTQTTKDYAVLFLMEDEGCRFKGTMEALNKEVDVFLMLSGNLEKKHDIIKSSKHNWSWDQINDGKDIEGRSSAIAPPVVPVPEKRRPKWNEKLTPPRSYATDKPEKDGKKKQGSK